MKRQSWLIAPLLLALFACTPPLKISYDYDTTADFAALKTFTWMPAAGNAAGEELLINRIKTAVNQELQGKSRTEVAADSDFLIAMHLSGRTVQGSSVGIGASIGIPVGHAGTINVGGGRSKPVQNLEGTLILDFIDAKTQALLWKATAVDVVRPENDPQAQQQRINAIVADMLSQFPPPK